MPHRFEVPDPRALQFAVGSFDTVDPPARADFPHRHAFYEIVFVMRRAYPNGQSLTRHL